MISELPPLSLYIHIPWCIRKCPYCDFNSHEKRDELPEARYVETLLSDLARDLDRYSGAVADRTVHSIFIGGGTPSLFSPDSIQHLLDGVEEQIPIKSGAEITLEANPGTFEREKFAELSTAGINRLSLGIQSFNDVSLRALGRVHDSNEAIAAAEHARAIFERMNLDLMHGLPMQEPADALSDLVQAIEIEPDQVSWYQLTLEPNTEFAVRPPRLPEDEALWRIQEEGNDLLIANAYKPYEVSAFARPGGTSEHNLNYWQFGDYLGIGAGAHGKLSALEGEQFSIWRTQKQRQPKRYMEHRISHSEHRQVEPDDLPFEFMLNALRLTQGVEADLYEQRTGLPLQSIEEKINTARQRGLLTENSERLETTELGQRFLNDLLELFMQD